MWVELFLPLRGFALALFLVICVSNVSATTNNIETAGQVRLGSVDLPFELQDYTQVSPDARHVVLPVKDSKNRIALNIGGHISKYYDTVYPQTLVFSDDSQTFGFVARRGAQFVVVINQQEFVLDYKKLISPQGDDDVARLILGPGGKRWACALHVGDKPYSTEGNEAIVVSGGKWLVFVDAKPSKLYDGVDWHGGPIFTRAGTMLAYIALLNHEQFVVLNDREEKHYPALGQTSLTFSPDGEHHSYVVHSNNCEFVVLDAQEQKSYKAIQRDSLLFSPDSRRIAYVAYTNAKSCLVDGRRESFFDDVGDPRFSPDSQHLAALATDAGRSFILVDNAAKGSWDGISGEDLFFSPNSQRLVYPAIRNGKWYLVENTNQEGPYEAIAKNSISFSPDSEHLAYAVRTPRGYQAVIDGKLLTAYRAIMSGTPTFSPDSRHLVYVGMMGKEIRLVVNERDGPFHCGTIITAGARGGIHFDSENTFHYIIHSENALQLISGPLEGGSVLTTPLPPDDFAPTQNSGPGSGLDIMTAEADLVFKGQVVSNSLLTNLLVRIPAAKLQATTFRVISVLKGKALTSIIFDHYMTGPSAWSGGRPPSNWQVEPGMSCLVFARKSRVGTHFRQLEAVPRRDDEGLLRTLDDRPLPANVSPKEAHWLELRLLLNDGNPSNQLYAIKNLELMSPSCTQPWNHSDDFRREAVLKILVPLIHHPNEEVASAALGCYRTGPECVGQIAPFAFNLAEVASSAESPSRRAAALLAFSETKLSFLKEYLPRWLKDPSAAVRAQAVQLLPDFPDAFAFPLLQDAASDPSPKVRKAADEASHKSR